MKFKEFINESINDKGILKSIFLAGQPGAGKSYTIQSIKSGQFEPRVVNIDKFVEQSKAYDNDTWSEQGDHLKVLTKSQLALYLNGLLPLWVDGTSSSPSAVIRRKGIVGSLGYDTGMVWVECSLETALRRAATRERKVDPEHIKKTFENMARMKPYYKSEFKYFLEINNDDGELTNELLVDAFRKTTQFFASPVENPMGTELINKMKSGQLKYLTDGVYSLEQIQRLVDSWYRN